MEKNPIIKFGEAFVNLRYQVWYEVPIFGHSELVASFTNKDIATYFVESLCLKFKLDRISFNVVDNSEDSFSSLAK